jgi:hypothetical protein
MLPFSYEMHEMAHFASAPARAFSDVARTDDLIKIAHSATCGS